MEVSADVIFDFFFRREALTITISGSDRTLFSCYLRGVWLRGVSAGLYRFKSGGRGVNGGLRGVKGGLRGLNSGVRGLKCPLRGLIGGLRGLAGLRGL